jgi:hypothetical protein
MEAPSSLRRALCRPLLRSTASSLGQHGLAGEAATDRRARQCRTGRGLHVACADSMVLGARAASGRREGAGRRGGVQRTRALWRAGARATSRPACFFSDWHCLRDKNSKFCN